MAWIRTAEIVRQHLAQRLVYLPRIALGSECATELALDRAEGGFYIAALMVVLHERFPSVSDGLRSDSNRNPRNHKQHPGNRKNSHLAYNLFGGMRLLPIFATILALYNPVGLITPPTNNGGALMRRLLVVVTAAVVMAAMMVTMAMPAFTAPNCEGLKDNNGQHRAHSNADDRFLETGDSKYSELSEKHYNKEVDCYDGVPPGEGQ